VEGFNWYWNQDQKFENIIENYFDHQNYHYDRDVMKIVLWQYENNQRMKNRSGALLDKELFDSYTIEHIAPQNPKIEANTEEFKKEYLHKAGNLALLTQSQNSKFGNKSFEDKWGLFQDTALSSYTEIREKSQWTESEIEARHKNISSFVKHYFSIPTDSIELPNES
jgi:gamma-glutamyltranspeptidase